MHHHPECIAIANQKGGVGKTTTAVNLAAALVLIFHKKVLLIDVDSQGNATSSLGIAKNELSWTLADVLLGECSMQQAIVSTDSGVDVVGANRELAGLDVVLATVSDAPLILQNAIQKTALAYDYIIMDCAPSLSLLTVNALCAADGVIIPMQCEYYALEGLADLLHTLETLKEINPKLTLRGIVRTIYDGRSTLTQDVSFELTQHFAEKVYQTTINKSIRLAEAPSFGKSIFAHQKSSKGAIAYQKLAEEVIKQSKQLSLLATGV